MRISCAFAPSRETPAHVAHAEKLGYERAWCYDSPALYADVWMTLALCASRTTRIGLGPAVLVPSLRHPMVNAAAIATLAQLAPGRVAAALGAGFSGRRAMGQKALTWQYVESYARTLRALLRGEAVDWEGGTMQMLHDPGSVPERPIEIPLLIGAEGPKGRAVASALGDGVFAAGAWPSDAPGRGRGAVVRGGTVLDPGETADSNRVRDAAGPGLAVLFHAAYERGGAEAVRGIPGGAAWLRGIESVPLKQRHLEVHRGHLVLVNENDRKAWSAGAQAMLMAVTLSGSTQEVRKKLDELRAQGVPELAYQPAGPDITRELDAFAHAAGLG